MTLTRRQREVFEFIRDSILNGNTPTVREVAEHFGFRSPLSAKLHIDALVRKGYLRKRPFLSRGLEIPGLLPKESVRLPVVGTIRAGSPILATENIEEYISVSRELFPLAEGFGLRVVGESMKGAGIMEGDIVIVRPEIEASDGDIVVALVGEEATVKRFFLKGDRVHLLPENPDFSPIVAAPDEVRIIGRVVGLIRRF